MWFHHHWKLTGLENNFQTTVLNCCVKLCAEIDSRLFPNDLRLFQKCALSLVTHYRATWFDQSEQCKPRHVLWLISHKPQTHVDQFVRLTCPSFPALGTGCMFSRAWHWLSVLISSSDWFIWLFASVMIGYMWLFWITIVIGKPLKRKSFFCLSCKGIHSVVNGLEWKRLIKSICLKETIQA